MRKLVFVLPVLILLSWMTSASGTGSTPLVSLYASSIPVRPPGAVTGSDFALMTAGMTERERQARAVDELLRGNIPRFLRYLKSVRVEGQTSDGQMKSAELWVSPDYLAIGNDLDFLRIPLDYFSATTVARKLGFLLPTPRIVDAIYEQSAVHLVPQPLQAGPLMRSCNYFLRHRELIETQRAGRMLGELIAGHKKDIVLTTRLETRPDRVAIYGWHRPNGQPIQPLSTFHGATYADYSHGLRLVYPTVWIDETPHSLYDVLEDPQLATLVSYEGPLHAHALMQR